MTMTHEMKDELIRDLELQLKETRAAKEALSTLEREIRQVLGMGPTSAPPVKLSDNPVTRTVQRLTGDRDYAVDRHSMARSAAGVDEMDGALLTWIRHAKADLADTDNIKRSRDILQAQLEQTEKLFELAINSIYREDQ